MGQKNLLTCTELELRERKSVYVIYLQQYCGNSIGMRINRPNSKKENNSKKRRQPPHRLRIYEAIPGYVAKPQMSRSFLGLSVVSAILILYWNRAVDPRRKFFSRVCSSPSTFSDFLPRLECADDSRMQTWELRAFCLRLRTCSLI